MKTILSFVLLTGFLLAQEADAKKKQATIPDPIALALWRARALMMDSRVDQANLVIEQKSLKCGGANDSAWANFEARIAPTNSKATASQAEYDKALKAVKDACVEGNGFFDEKAYTEDKILRCVTP